MADTWNILVVLLCVYNVWYFVLKTRMDIIVVILLCLITHQKNKDYPYSFTANFIDKGAFEKLSLLFEKVFHFLNFILRTWSSY